VYRTELAALVVRMYFWKLLLTAHLGDAGGSDGGMNDDASPAPSELSCSFNHLWRGLASLGTTLKLADAATQFENLGAKQKRSVMDDASAAVSLIRMDAVCEWYANAMSPGGMKVEIDTFAHGFARTEIASFADNIHGLLGNVDELRRIWGGKGDAARKAGDVLQQLAETFPQLATGREKGLAGRAYARISCAPDPARGAAAGSLEGGELLAAHLESFVAVICYMHTMIVAFPVLGSLAAMMVTYDQFIHMVGCLSLSRPSSELSAVFDAMVSNTNQGQKASRVAFDEVVAWYASVRCPELAGTIHGSQIETVELEDDAEPIFWDEVTGPVLDKKLRKEMLAKYAIVEKHVFTTLNTDGGVARVFSAIDTNANSIVSLEELGTYLRAKPCEIDSPVAIVRALLVATGKTATVDDVAGGNAASESAFTGNAWMARREFGIVFSMAVYFTKIIDLFSLSDAPITSPHLNLTFPTFQKVTKLIGIATLSKKAKAQEVFDRLRTSRGSKGSKDRRGWAPDAVTLDDFVLWYAQEQCGAALMGSGTAGANDGGRRLSTMNALFAGASAGIGFSGAGIQPSGKARKPSKKMSKKQKRMSMAAAAEGKHVRLKQLIALEGKVAALALPENHEADGYWKELDVHSDGTISLVDFSTKILGTKFAVLDRPVVLRQVFASTTRRECNADCWVEHVEFLPLLVNAYYFNKLDHELVPDGELEGVSIFDAGNPTLEIERVSECLKSLGMIMTMLELTQELGLAGDATAVAADVFCMWYAKRKCPKGTEVKPQASPLTDEEQKLEALVGEPIRLQQFLRTAAGSGGGGGGGGGDEGGAAQDSVDVLRIRELLNKEYPTIQWSAGAMQTALTRGAGKPGKVIDSSSGEIKIFGDCEVDSSGFQKYLFFLLYYNKLYSIFGVTGEVAAARGLTFVDFKSMVRKGGVRIADDTAAKEFTTLSEKASAEGTASKGLAIFDNVVEYIAQTKLAPVLQGPGE